MNRFCCSAQYCVLRFAPITATADLTVEYSSPRVSVVLPVYNGAAYLAAAIASVQAQTERDLELIVVDDGSTDASAAIVREHAASDDRIRLFGKPNSGISETLNLGLRESRAPWIARLDADDLMLPERLARQLAFVADAPDIAAAGSYYTVMDAHAVPRMTRYPLPRTREELQDLLARRQALAFTHPTMIYRRDLALALGGYRRALEPCEDADLFARMIGAGHAILIQPEVLTLYRVHDGSISARSAGRSFLTLRYIWDDFYARREGRPPLDLAAYAAALRARPLRARLQWRFDQTSDLLYRRATGAQMRGKRAQAAVLLAAAAAFRPVKALRRTLRAGRARLSRA